MTDPSSVEVLGLSANTVCFTLDENKPAISNGQCGSSSILLPVDNTISLSGCGPQKIQNIWEDDTAKYTTTASYLLEAPECNLPTEGLTWDESNWDEGNWN